MKSHQGQGHSSTRPSGDRRKPRSRGRFRLTPEVLNLEDRWLLSTFTVTDPSDSLTNGLPTVNTLRWAVAQADAANTPSTIAFDLGTAPTTITLTNGQLELSNTADPITIDGPGSGLLAISGDDANRIFQVAPGVVASISVLELEDGSASTGGAISNQGGLTLDGCLFLNNTAPPSQFAFGNFTGYGAGLGGAIYNDNGTLSLADCTLTGNTATRGGAIFSIAYNGDSDVSLTGCTLSGNAAVEAVFASTYLVALGGAIGINATGGQANLSLTDCTISGNSAGSGGGISSQGGTLSIAGGSIQGNQAA